MKFTASSILDKFKKGKKNNTEEVDKKVVEDEGGRETWGGQCDFFLSSLGYAGNDK